MKHTLTLFLTAYLQIALVAISTYAIANHLMDMVFLAAFAISWMWTLNVKRIAISTNTERFIYAFGAGLGSLTGTILTNWL